MSTIRTGTTTTTAITVTGDTTGTLTLTADSGVIDASATTGAVNLPVGTTAQRPSTPTEGAQRYNSTLKVMEIFTGNSTWEAITTSTYLYSATYLSVTLLPGKVAAKSIMFVTL